MVHSSIMGCSNWSAADIPRGATHVTVYKHFQPIARHISEFGPAAKCTNSWQTPVVPVYAPSQRDGAYTHGTNYGSSLNYVNSSLKKVDFQGKVIVKGNSSQYEFWIAEVCDFISPLWRYWTTGISSWRRDCRMSWTYRGSAR